MPATGTPLDTKVSFDVSYGYVDYEVMTVETFDEALQSVMNWMEQQNLRTEVAGCGAGASVTLLAEGLGTAPVLSLRFNSKGEVEVRDHRTPENAMIDENYDHALAAFTQGHWTVVAS